MYTYIYIYIYTHIHRYATILIIIIIIVMIILPPWGVCEKEILGRKQPFGQRNDDLRRLERHSRTTFGN